MGRAAEAESLLRQAVGRFPDWVWTHRGSTPLKDGFLNRWHASVPIGNEVVEVDGVCTVQLRDGLIYANEVFFDRSDMLARMVGPTGNLRAPTLKRNGLVVVGYHADSMRELVG